MCYNKSRIKGRPLVLDCEKNGFVPAQDVETLKNPETGFWAFFTCKKQRKEGTKMQDYADIRNIVGIEKVNFTKDGKEIMGDRLYTLENIPAGRGTGKKSDKIFLSEAKLKQMSFTPTVGQTVTVYYNRYGGVSHLALAEDDLIDLG